MTPDEFAEKIKTKYPAYKNIDNATLAKKVVEKYPVYASQVKFEQPKQEIVGGVVGNYIKRVGNQYMDSAKSIMEGVSKGAEQYQQGVQEGNLVKSTGGLLRAGLRTAGGVASATFAPITAAIEPVVTPVIQKIASIPGVTGGIKAASDWATKHPEAAKDLGNVFDIATLGAGGAAEKPIIGAAEKGVKTATEITQKSIKAGTEILENRATNKVISSAMERVTPEFNALSAAKKEKLISETVKDEAGNILPRVNEGGTIKGRTINMTPAEKEAATELSKVQGYKSSLSNLETHNLIKTEITKEAASLSKGLSSEPYIMPKKEVVSVVKKAVNSVPEESFVLQKSDPIIGNYLRVVQNAANKVDGKLNGALELRKIMDLTYENARGKLAFGSDKLSALDEVHQSGRNALNQYIISKAKNTNVKASLRKQMNLYRADDAILPKAGREAGSKLEKTVKVIKKHPYISGAVGLGAAERIIKNTTGIGF